MSDLKNMQVNVRFDVATGEQIKSYAEQLGGDAPMFVRRCVKEICEMIANPEKNDLPEIVALIRFAESYKANPTPLKGKASRKTA